MAGPDSRIKRIVFALVDLGGRSPFAVLFVAFVILAACWSYTRKLEVRSDVMELLPRDSPGFQAFEHRLERVGGRATIVIVVESPDRTANERLVDAAAAALRTAHGMELVSSVETGTKDARAFFQANKWLYADLKELEEADEKLDHNIAVQSGLVEDLSGDGPESSLGKHVSRQVEGEGG